MEQRRGHQGFRRGSEERRRVVALAKRLIAITFSKLQTDRDPLIGVPHRRKPTIDSVTTCQRLARPLHYPFAMTAKRATVRFYVAIVGLLASVLELAGAFVRLVTVCLDRAASRLKSPVDASTRLALAPTVIAPPARAAASHTITMGEDERLTSALMNLGFRAANVRAFTASVSGRQAPLETLVKEGIVALSAN
jgi:hypothetical protein